MSYTIFFHKLSTNPRFSQRKRITKEHEYRDAGTDRSHCRLPATVGLHILISDLSASEKQMYFNKNLSHDFDLCYFLKR